MGPELESCHYFRGFLAFRIPRPKVAQYFIRVSDGDLDVCFFMDLGAVEERATFWENATHGVKRNQVFFVLAREMAEINDRAIQIAEKTVRIIRRSVWAACRL